jgi:hypothetical protein
MRPPLLRFEHISFVCTNQRVREFIDGLDANDQAKLLSAARIAATSLAVGRPPANRWQKVRGSPDLFELKVTPPGARGPHTRLVCTIENSTVLILAGVVKRQRALPAATVKQAERELARWRVEDDDAGE